jgi:hypothetical protein
MDDANDRGKLKRKEHERRLVQLHVEFVKLQQWVVHQGLKVGIRSEGATASARAAPLRQ